MNREIKFRAWDKITNKMCYLNDPHWSLSLQFGKDGLGVYNLQNGSGGDEYELMQYTGLKDKNGKECFDCDVIRAKANPADTPRKSAVFWTNHGWQVNLKGTNRFLSDLGDFEIIGNIYQNPDLLPVSPEK